MITNIKNKRTVLGLLFILIIFAILFVIFAGNFFANLGGYQWDTNSINDFLELPLPTDAEEIEYDGYRGRGGWLSLSFVSSSQSMDEFVSKFCNNTLHQNYDPFQATDTDEWLDNAYLITMGDSSYYSYSPDVTETTFGMRCLSYSKGQIQLVVDKANQKRNFVKMEILFNCTKCR